MEERSIDEARAANPLQEGDLAPDFRLPSLSGTETGPGDYRGQKRVVLAFYPKDLTSG